MPLVRLFFLALVAAVVTGCQASPEIQSTVPPVDNGDQPVVEEEVFIPEFVPGGSALENKAFVDYLFEREDALANGRVTVEAFLAVLHDSGFESAPIEYTRETSLIELPADSTSLAIRIADQCLITQWGSDRYGSSVEEVLVTDTCLLGKTETLD